MKLVKLLWALLLTHKVYFNASKQNWLPGKHYVQFRVDKFKYIVTLIKNNLFCFYEDKEGLLS
jgi:hypothetical protein